MTHTPLIGSLCTGTGALDLAVEQVLGARTAWYAQFDPKDLRHQHVAKIFAHHRPDVPNWGDIGTVTWTKEQYVDILTAGWPCQDMSLAGRRTGMMPGTRSGLWTQVARAIRELRPPLVILENVRSLTSARAHSDLELCPGCMGETRPERPLRALGCVLGDLADLRYDARWTCVRASDVGAPHRRERVFILAWPAADAAHDGLQRGGGTR